jgi:hypothetical protein
MRRARIGWPFDREIEGAGSHPEYGLGRAGVKIPAPQAMRRGKEHL